MEVWLLILAIGFVGVGAADLRPYSEASEGGGGQPR